MFTHLLLSYTSQEDKSLLKNTTPFIVTSFFVIYSILLLTDGYYFLIFLAVGFSLGAFNSLNTNVEYKIPNYEKREVILLEECSSKQVELFYPPLTKVVNQLLDYVMRDFVQSWWNPMNYYQDTAFEIVARNRLNTMFLNIQKILLNQERNDIVMSTLYGVANTLIIHMRECRSLEESGLSIDEYVTQNPQSPFGQLFSKEEQHRQLKGLSHTFLNRTLPPADKNSMLQMSLFNELLASYLFGSILDSTSDPDYLNCWIIHLLSDKNEITSAISEAVLMESMAEELVDDDASTTSSFEQLSSPDTPESMSLHSSTVFSSVSFTVMDISAPPQSTTPNKADLVYIIQIEKPENHAGSEGGGYIITRTYSDFETLHTVLCARYMKRISKIQLKLPLTSSKSWLQKKRMSLNTISSGLEVYIDTVVKDEELGADSAVAAFLRKERHTEDGLIVAFADEFKEEAAVASQSPRSLFSRSSTQSSLIDTENSKWFALKSKTRNNSIQQNTEEEEKPVIQDAKPIDTQDTPLNTKSLSSMDVELLIETTYALVVEIFNLTTANNKAWMRRSILNLLREIVRRSYAEFISDQYTDFVNAYMSPDAIVQMLNNLGESFWPEGKWGEAQPVRNEEDKLASRQLARELLMAKLIPNAVRQLIGDQNCNLAMDRIWARIQDPNLNRVLIIQILERVIKPVLG